MLLIKKSLNDAVSVVEPGPLGGAGSALGVWTIVLWMEFMTNLLLTSVSHSAPPALHPSRNYLQRSIPHVLADLQDADVRFVRPRRLDRVDELRRHIDVWIRHVPVGVRVRVAGVVPQ